jgi:putative membrane protein
MHQIPDRPRYRAGRPQFTWLLRLSVLTAASALFMVGAVGAAQAQPAGSRTNVMAPVVAPAGVTLQTEEVALTEADRDFITKVRLAGLWEIPASKMAIEKGVAPRVRQIGQMIAAQHVRLDLLSRTAAKEVGVELPDVPTAEQRRWLDEMKDASGTDFDDVYIARLRAAHGKIFPVIGLIRASTESDVVRKLAQSANAFVLTHLTLLESTGLVRYDELPKAAAPAVGPTVKAENRTMLNGGIAISVIWLILGVALIAGTILITRIIRPEGFGNHGFGNRGQDRQRRIVEHPRDAEWAASRSAENFYPEQGLRLSRGSRSHR